VNGYTYPGQGIDPKHTYAYTIQVRSGSGCSAAWLARFVRDEEAGGSNPPTPTIDKVVIYRCLTINSSLGYKAGFISRQRLAFLRAARMTVCSATDNIMKKRVHIYYGGRVQGVGFRFTVQRIAERLNISGWVKNLPNREVEIIAEGEQADLREFLLTVKHEMDRYISTDNVQWHDSTGEFKKFNIRF
jgi:acylphosphatase